MLPLINIALSWPYNKKTRALDSSRDSSGYLTILVLVAVALLATACGSSSSTSSQSDSSLSGEMAQLTVTIPGLKQSKSGQASNGSIAHRDGVPAEVTSLIIDVLNTSSEVLNAVEVIGTNGTVSLTFAAGENYTLRGRAFAGNELLFLGQSALASVKAGSVTRVSLSLADQINLVLTAFGDIEIGIGATPASFNLTGLKDLSISWYVNGVLGGNAEFGLIDTSGQYTPPATLPANPVITILAEPVRSPSFAQAFSFNLLPTDTTNNAPPNAVAGSDQAVNPAALVTLLATASNDADGSVVAYSWTRVSGSITPVVANANTATASFTAPLLQYGGVVTYRLSVTDNEGASATDDITITVNGTDQPLAADAGVDQVVSESTMVTLDGSASNDPDNVITTYLWEELSSGGLVLSNSGAQMPTFNAPGVTISTNFQFRLTVTNDNGDQSQGTVTITVNNVVVSGNNVYFAATQNFANHTIWVTDGTAPGTQQVTTVETSNFDILASKIIGDYLYFSGNDGSNGTELWRTNGVNTEMFASALDAAYVGEGASASGSPSAFSVLTDKLLYRAVTSSLNGSNRSAEYLSLNTVTQVVTPLSVVNISSFTNNQVGTFNGFSYFYRKNTSPAISTTLYRTDGVNNATLVASFPVFSEIHDFAEVNGQLFFAVGNNQLWKTDGTGAGTTLLKTFTGFVGDGSGLSFSGEKNVIAFNNNLIFVADNGEGRELWLSDGTTPGTILVKDLDATVASSNPTEFNIVNGRLLFLSSAAGASTDGLWQTDGTNIGTVRLSNVLVNSDINSYEGISTGVTTVVDSLNLMFFTANDGLNGNELWATDGTAGGTTLVKNLNTLGNSQPATFRAGTGFLIFTAQDDDGRAKLWRTDGTDPGTTLISDINTTGFGNSAFFPLGG